MLKKRIIACLPVRNGIVVQSIGFNKYLPVGSPAIAAEFLNKWGIDEIALIDITARKNDRSPDFSLIKATASKCFVPLTVGGGIRNLSDVEELMHCGADKVSLNNHLHANPQLITDIAKAYGDQCAVVSIDGKRAGDGSYKVYNYLTKELLNMTVVEAAVKAASLGAGEILLNSVDRDGTYTGYELPMIEAVCKAVTIPVLAAGGAKNATDMLDLMKNTDAAAACAGNFFHFYEHSVNITKQILVRDEINLRLDTHADYADSNFDSKMRLAKKEDDVLEHMLYMRIIKEII